MMHVQVRAHMRRSCILVCASAVLMWLVACGARSGTVGDPYSAFAHPQRVSILDYTGDAMEPFVSPNGRYLFFNSSNAAPTTELRYAERVDDVAFRYKGPVGGVNAPGTLAAVASLDRNSEL